MDNQANIAQNFYSVDDLRNHFRLLWSQNIMWTRFLIISLISKSDDILVVTNRLFENPRDFSNLLKLYYGDAQSKEFEQLFQDYITLTIKLIKDYILGNINTETETQLYEKAAQIATFLSSINPYWNQNLLQKLLFDHLDMTKDEIMKRLNKDYAADVYLYDFIEYHALMIADIMSNGLIRQFY